MSSHRHQALALAANRLSQPRENMPPEGIRPLGIISTITQLLALTPSKMKSFITVSANQSLRILLKFFFSLIGDLIKKLKVLRQQDKEDCKV